MEFCEYGDLYSLLHSVRKKKVYVNEEIIWDIAYQSLLALEYLHSANIIHRDIKLLNIFMAKDKTIKIGDMGMSKLLSKKEMKMSRVGTPLYIAPELVKKEKYDYKADIWSLGCSLYHLAKTVPPFNDENLIRLGQAIVNEQPPSLPNCYTEKLFQFILKLMTKDKFKRPSATEALELIPDKIKVKYSEKTNNNNKTKTDNNMNNKGAVKENKKKKKLK
jgi:NIMA (never in mitosis gene a)-related kinase